MKTSKLSTMPRHLDPKVFKPRLEQIEVYAKLCDLLAPYAKTLRAQTHIPLEYVLWTEHEHRTKGLTPRRKNGVMFAGVSFRKHYIGFYFYPLLINEDLRKLVPEHLVRMLYGNSAFRITNIDDSIQRDVKALLKIGWTYYSEIGWVRKTESVFVTCL